MKKSVHSKSATVMGTMIVVAIMLLIAGFGVGATIYFGRKALVTFITNPEQFTIVKLAVFGCIYIGVALFLAVVTWAIIATVIEMVKEMVVDVKRPANLPKLQKKKIEDFTQPEDVAGAVIIAFIALIGFSFAAMKLWGWFSTWMDTQVNFSTSLSAIFHWVCGIGGVIGCGFAALGMLYSGIMVVMSYVKECEELDKFLDDTCENKDSGRSS